MKLYVIVRADLEDGAVAVQACHALRLFSAEHPTIDAYWYQKSNNLVLLAVPDERALLALARRVDEAGFAHSVFREIDFNDDATALALEPDGWRLVSSLPKALKPRKVAA